MAGFERARLSAVPIVAAVFDIRDAGATYLAELALGLDGRGRPSPHDLSHCVQKLSARLKPCPPVRHFFTNRPRILTLFRSMLFAEVEHLHGYAAYRVCGPP